MNFDKEIAVKYGVNEAIIIQHLQYWLEKNRANNKNIYDGEVWTYNTLDAWVELFPFWSRRQIERLLKNMHVNGLIDKGNYNKSSYDRTTWYTLKPAELRISPNGEINITKRGNEYHQTVTTIPNNYTDNKNNIRPCTDARLPDSLCDHKKIRDDETFTQFWNLYPKKENKKKAKSTWNRLSKPKRDLALKDIKSRYEGIEKRYIPLPTTYLNGERWEDEIEAKTNQTLVGGI